MGPLVAANASWRDESAQVVVQNLGRSARQAADAGVPELGQVVAGLHPGTLTPVGDLFGREGVNMEAGESLGDSSAYSNVKVSWHGRGQAGLDANLRCAELPGFRGASDDFGDGQQIPFVTAVSSAECAKAAFFDANVGEIDVAIDHIGHLFPDGSAPHGVRGLQERQKLRPLAFHKASQVGNGQVVPFQGLVQNAGDAHVKAAQRSFQVSWQR